MSKSNILYKILQFTNTTFFKIIGMSIFFALLLTFSTVNFENKIATGIFILISIVLFFVINDRNDGDDEKKDSDIGTLIVTSLLSLLISEVLLFQSLIFNLNSSDVKVVIETKSVKEKISNYDDEEYLKITKNDSVETRLLKKQSKLMAELSNDIKQIVLITKNIDTKVQRINEKILSPEVKYKEITLYNVTLYNKDNNEVISTHFNLTKSKMEVYEKIKSINSHIKYVPFITYKKVSSFSYFK
jgi:hypothetical protein